LAQKTGDIYNHPLGIQEKTPGGWNLGLPKNWGQIFKRVPLKNRKGFFKPRKKSFGIWPPKGQIWVGPPKNPHLKLFWGGADNRG